MQRKPSYYLKQSVATVLAAAAGLVVGLQIETNQATTRSNADAYFVMQAFASDAFVLFATPPRFVPCTADCVDPTANAVRGSKPNASTSEETS